MISPHLSLAPPVPPSFDHRFRCCCCRRPSWVYTSICPLPFFLPFFRRNGSTISSLRCTHVHHSRPCHPQEVCSPLSTSRITTSLRFLLRCFSQVSLSISFRFNIEVNYVYSGQNKKGNKHRGTKGLLGSDPKPAMPRKCGAVSERQSRHATVAN